ncbi:hypothetical protein QQP08_007225, partial [Theobroma cacao]
NIAYEFLALWKSLSVRAGKRGSNVLLSPDRKAHAFDFLWVCFFRQVWVSCFPRAVRAIGFGGLKIAFATSSQDHNPSLASQLSFKNRDYDKLMNEERRFLRTTTCSHLLNSALSMF